MSFATLLNQTLVDLTQLRDQYAAVERSRAGDFSAQAEAQLAGLLVSREGHTINALRGYLDEDEHRVVLDVHVRLGGGFPFHAEELQLPDNPTLDELLGVAARSDDLLALLSERIKLYAAAPELLDALASFEAIVLGRRRQLAAALSELENYTPSRP